MYIYEYIYTTNKYIYMYIWYTLPPFTNITSNALELYLPVGTFA